MPEQIQRSLAAKAEAAREARAKVKVEGDLERMSERQKERM